LFRYIPKSQNTVLTVQNELSDAYDVMNRPICFAIVCINNVFHLANVFISVIDSTNIINIIAMSAIRQKIKWILIKGLL